MKTLLVPVGSSKNAKSHLQFAIDFAKTFGAKIFLIQVYNVYTKAGTMIKIDHILERESQAYLNEIVNAVNTKGVEVITRTLKGHLIDTLALVCKTTKVDLILIGPRTTSTKKEVYLGKTSGRIIKKTQIPTLIVPEDYTFKPFKTVLLAIKSAIIKKEGVLNPLIEITKQFKATINLLLVKTTYHKPEDFNVKNPLKDIINKMTITENATTFQGVLEHFQSQNPDLLCVVRRKRGFFTKKWEKNTILKRDFNSKIPVLVLRELK